MIQIYGEVFMAIRRRDRSVQLCTSNGWVETPEFEAALDSDVIEWTPEAFKHQSWCHHVAVKRPETDVVTRDTNNVFLQYYGTVPEMELIRRQFRAWSNLTEEILNPPAGDPERSQANSILRLSEGLHMSATLSVPVMIWEFKDTIHDLGAILKKFKKIYQIMKAPDITVLNVWKNHYQSSPHGIISWETKETTRSLQLVRKHRPNLASSLKELSSNWLLLQLGIAPTVSDCKGIVKIMQQLRGAVALDNRRNVVGTHLRANYKIRPQDLPSNPPSAWDRSDDEIMVIRGGQQTGSFYPADPKVYKTLGYQGCATGIITSRRDLTLPTWLRQKTGFGMGPIPVYWETIRLSWVLDYFIGVGNFLALVDRYAVTLDDPQNEFSDGIWLTCQAIEKTYCCQSSAEVTWWQHPLVADPPYQKWYVRYRTRWAEPLLVLERRVFDRNRATAPMMGELLMNSISGMRLSYVRLGTLAALWHQLWGPQGPRRKMFR